MQGCWWSQWRDVSDWKGTPRMCKRSQSLPWMHWKLLEKDCWRERPEVDEKEIRLVLIVLFLNYMFSLSPCLQNTTKLIFNLVQELLKHFSHTFIQLQIKKMLQYLKIKAFVFNMNSDRFFTRCECPCFRKHFMSLLIALIITCWIIWSVFCVSDCQLSLN